MGQRPARPLWTFADPTEIKRRQAEACPTGANASTAQRGADGSHSQANV